MHIFSSAVESLPCEVKLSDVENMRKKGMEKRNLSRITVSEGLIPRVESSFLWLASIEVSRDHAIGFRVECGHCGVKSRHLSRKFLRVNTGSKKILTTNKIAGTRLYVHNVVSALTNPRVLQLLLHERDPWMFKNFSVLIYFIA